MKWLYQYERVSMGKGYDPIVGILLRPTIFDPEGHKMIGKVVRLQLIAAEHIMTNKVLAESAKDPNFRKIYFEELNTKDYYINDQPIAKDHEMYLATAYIYVKQDGFTPEDIFEWVRTYFTIKGYQHSEFEQALPEDFLDLNPLLNALMKAEGIIVEPDELKKKKKKKKRRPRKL